MRAIAHILRRILKLVAAVLVAPVVLLIAALVLGIADICWLVAGRRRAPADRMPNISAASIVIPNWNGRDLLEKYLPSVVDAVSENARNEIIVVDNGSVDGSVEFLRQFFPQVQLIALDRNLGFGGGSNAGFHAAKNDIVVLLNNDMRVTPGFLEPLLNGFSDSSVFAVSCQIFLGDPEKRREETGLTEGWWANGKLRVSHRDDPKVQDLFPCFYPGGGSSAFDRDKFLELCGFDELLNPFYLEDTDLGYQGWKRGWKILYQPASMVYHEHRGTIGRKFSAGHIESVLKRNYLLFCWKNIHTTDRFLASMGAAWVDAMLSATGSGRPGRSNIRAIWNAFLRLKIAVASRWRARSLASVNDREAFARPRGAYFRDRFSVQPPGARLRVLFVSPYPILPPIHGGAVFMYEALRQLAKHCEVHALVLLDHAGQVFQNERLNAICSSVELLLRPNNRLVGSIQPHAVSEFAGRDVQWAIDRISLQKQIDVLQIEYTPMAQYAGQYARILTALFEHDVHFQSVGRALEFISDPLDKLKASYEYLRALRYEMKELPRFDCVQVCTKENRDYLLSFAPGLASRLDYGLRACISACDYSFPGGPREPDTILFIGSSRHRPNRIAMEWFMAHVFSRITALRPRARLKLVGFEGNEFESYRLMPQVEMPGYVENVKPLLETCSVFICPVRSGSGVRVKLLEAFAGGIPVVSTFLGAEGLAATDGVFCSLTDDPEDFARKTLDLLASPDHASAMAARARAEIEKNWDAAVVTERLLRAYREGLFRKCERLSLPAMSPEAPGLS